MMRSIRMLPYMFLALALLLGTMTMGSASAVQGDAALEQSAAIHPGTCDDLDPDPAFNLGTVSPNIEEATDDPPGGAPEIPVDFIGFAGASPVASADTTLDATFDDIFNEDQPYSLVVHETSDPSSPVQACGELGGLETDGRISIALQPETEPGIAGIGIFDEDDAGFLGLGEEEVNVTIHVFTVATVGAPDVATPEPASADAIEPGYANEQWLVDVAWLEEQIDPETASVDDLEDLSIVGVFPRDEQQEELVPSSTILDPAILALTDTSEESIEEWRLEVTRQVIAIGQSADSSELEAGDRVVLYDDGSLDAMALWWVMDYLGHEDKRLLNGGLDAWIAENDLLGTGFPPAGTGPRVPIDDQPESLSGGLDPDVLATIDEVQSVLDDPNVVLVDARSPEEYAAGHLPGAVNVPAIENVTPDGAPYLADAEQLRERYAQAGVTPDVRVITYGGEAFSPHVTYFTLGLLGFEDVAVYPGGWVEWSQYPALPRESSE